MKRYLRMKLLYYTLLFVILASCKDQKGQQDIGIWHFDVTKEYPTKEIYIQDIADVDYIPLETNDSMLWLGRDIAFFDDDHIIAANPRTGVLIHNREGEALHSFHHLGGGPEEYRGLYFADYDKKEDDWTVNLNKKNENGQFEIPDGEYTVEVVVTDLSSRTQTISRVYKIDNTAPLVVIKRPGLDDAFGRTIRVTGDIGDENTLSALYFTAYEKSSDGKIQVLGKTQKLSNISGVGLDIVVVDIAVLVGIDFDSFVGIVVAVVGIVVGFGAQSLIEDVITGLFIILEGEFGIGDIITIDGFRGEVKSIGLRTVSIIDLGGNIRIINNSEIGSLVNLSEVTSVAVVNVPISYEDPLKQAEAAVQEALSELPSEYPEIFKEAPIYKGVDVLAESHLELMVVANVAEENIYNARRIMQREIRYSCEKAGLTAPSAE